METVQKLSGQKGMLTSNVDDDISLWNEENFYYSPDWKCMLSDDEKEGELHDWEFEDSY